MTQISVDPSFLLHSQFKNRNAPRTMMNEINRLNSPQLRAERYITSAQLQERLILLRMDTAIQILPRDNELDHAINSMHDLAVGRCGRPGNAQPLSIQRG